MFSCVGLATDNNVELGEIAYMVGEIRFSNKLAHWASLGLGGRDKVQMGEIWFF